MEGNYLGLQGDFHVVAHLCRFYTRQNKHLKGIVAQRFALKDFICMPMFCSCDLVRSLNAHFSMPNLLFDAIQRLLSHYILTERGTPRDAGKGVWKQRQSYFPRRGQSSAGFRESETRAADCKVGTSTACSLQVAIASLHCVSFWLACCECGFNHLSDHTFGPAKHSKICCQNFIIASCKALPEVGHAI